MRRCLPTMACLSIATVSVFAHDLSPLGPHEHGIAQLNIVADGPQLLMQFDIPAINLLGFEHPPHSDEEKQRLLEARTVLDDPSSWITLPPSAACTSADKKIGDPFHDRASSAHYSFRPTYLFHCGQADALTRISLQQLFTRFPGNEAVKVQIVGSQGQSATTLTTDRADITLK